MAFHVFEAVPFTTFSLLASMIVLDLSSCCPPLLNNMLEHPKAASTWEVLLAAGCMHQRSQTKSFLHSSLCP